MNVIHTSLRIAVVAAICILLCVPALAQVADDRQISIANPGDVDAKRKALIDFIWGPPGMPRDRLPKVEKDDVSPITGVENLRRVDTLVTEMEAKQTGFAHHFIPTRPNNRLVIVHHGHAVTFADGPQLDSGYGMQRTINGLLKHGFSVLAVYMPQSVNFKTRVTGKPSNDPPLSHNQMFDQLHVEHGSVLKFFLEPVAICIDYLKTRSAEDDFPRYEDFSMTGLSGGGWTTTLYAAIDPRIRLSIPVAGTIPLYLRFGGSIGDREQSLAEFYKICGYPELYLLASEGAGRRQIQILNRSDDCCFGQKQHDPKAASGISFDDAVHGYERSVQQSLATIGAGGSFSVVIDEKAAGHMISWPAFTDIILPALEQPLPSSAAKGKR